MSILIADKNCRTRVILLISGIAPGIVIVTWEELAVALQKIQGTLHLWERQQPPQPGLFDFVNRRKAQLHYEQGKALLSERNRAFDALYRQVNPRLELYLRSQNWKFEGTLTFEDLRNEAWKSLIEKIDSFDPARGKFISWFFTFVVSVVLNRERRSKMRQNAQQNNSVELESLEGPTSMASLLDGFPPECQEVIHGTVANMAERLRVIVLGLYFREPPKKQKDLAIELSITAAAVNQNKFRALTLLKEALTAVGCQP
jgi:RNA polymerase sigma factor (sigma-70 family)